MALFGDLGKLWLSRCLRHSVAVLQDIFTLFHLDRPFKFVSKTSNFFIPIVGWSMFLTGGAARDSLSAVLTAQQSYSRGLSLYTCLLSCAQYSTRCDQQDPAGCPQMDSFRLMQFCRVRVRRGTPRQTRSKAVLPEGVC